MFDKCVEENHDLGCSAIPRLESLVEQGTPSPSRKRRGIIYSYNVYTTPIVCGGGLQSLNRNHRQFGGSRYRTEREVRFIFDGSKGEILSSNCADDLVNIYNVLIG